MFEIYYLVSVREPAKRRGLNPSHHLGTEGIGKDSADLCSVSASAIICEEWGHWDLGLILKAASSPPSSSFHVLMHSILELWKNMATLFNCHRFLLVVMGPDV